MGPARSKRTPGCLGIRSRRTPNLSARRIGMKAMLPLIEYRCAISAAVVLSTTVHGSSSMPILARLEPRDGCYVGVNLAAGDTTDAFSFRVGWRPAVYGGFFDFPLTSESRRQVIALME